MLPIERKSNALAIRQNKYLEDKKNLLQNEHVLVKVGESDLRIANAGVEQPIRLYEDADLINIVAKASKMICRDVGIKDWNNPEIMKYDAMRFFTTLKNYYKDLSLKEVKMAFELAAVGELDEWLPKGKGGEPDKNHYQSFSMEYYTKILKAYRVKKNKVWTKVKKALPPAEMRISDEQRKINKLAFLQDIYDAFDRYKNEGVEPNFILSIFYKEFVNRGLIDGDEPTSKKSINRAYRNVLDSDAPRKEKKAIIQAFHKNNILPILMSSAESIENNERIKNYFDKIIRENLDIRLVIKTESDAK